MTIECRILDQPYQPTLSIRTRSAVEQLPQVLGNSFSEIMSYLQELGETPSGPPYAAYYNMDMENLDIEIGIPVTCELPGREKIQASGIPGGQVATCLHCGPYDTIEPAYKALSEWIAAKGLSVTGVAVEMYLNDPTQDTPDQLQTQILFPLAQG
jgi:effector-binding domain-containing protein